MEGNNNILFLDEGVVDGRTNEPRVHPIETRGRIQKAENSRRECHENDKFEI